MTFLNNTSQVYFDENPEVKHVFEKDLFHHLFGEMMTTASGMFMFNDSETLAWFPSTVRLQNHRSRRLGVQFNSIQFCIAHYHKL